METTSKPSRLEWTLRVGVCMCFVGHGAFGILTKEAWVRYFAVAGIGRDSAYALMPLIGALDITMGILVLIRPVPIVLAWMTLWAIWTAALRPLSGEPFWEALERAGNYGAPAALLALYLPIRGPRGWLTNLPRKFPARAESPRVRRILQCTVALLLFGHGVLGVMGKHALTLNYASVLPQHVALAITPVVGWLEIGLAAAAFLPIPALLFAIAAWKLASEGLFLTAGAPVWEWIEHGGSYAAPVAVALILRRERAERVVATSGS